MRTKANVNILLVDDQPKNLLALEAILKRSGQNLVKAHSGEEALRYLLDQEFAVILLDVQMPKMDGFETARLIRERPVSRHTPIIFITDSDASGLRGYCLGAVDYLLKPIVPEILLSKVSLFISVFEKTQEITRQAAQLKARQHKLQRERAKHKQAEAAWKQAKQELEIKVAERTAALKRTNDQLVAEFFERRQVEIALKESEQQLELPDLKAIAANTCDTNTDDNSDAYSELRLRQQAQELLRQRVERERLIAASVRRIRETLDLEVILNTTVAEVRQFLQVDRVLVYRLWSDGTGSTIAEAVVSGCLRILGQTFPAEVFPQEFHQLYCQGRVRAVVEPEKDEVAPCLIEFLKQWGVKSKLVVPIVYQGELWGLLIAHQCSQPREWQPLEMDLLQQLAIQLAIAIQQADLYQQVQLELAERKQAQEALRESQERLQLVIDAANDGIWDWDIKGNTIFWSERVYQFLGLDPHVVVPSYELLFQLVHPEDKSILEQGLQNHLEFNHPYKVEFRMQRANGSYGWFLGKGIAVRDESGRPIRMAGSMSDITECKLAEEQLKKSEASLAEAQKLAHVGNWEFDVATQKITWSEELFRIYGLDPVQGEPTFLEHLQQFFPEDRVVLERCVAAAIAQRKPYEFDLRIKRPDGSIRYLAAKGQLFFNDWGLLTRLFGTVLDITERKLAEEALRQARDQLELRVAERTAELTRMNAELQAEIRDREAAARQRQRAEEALRTSEERFRVALKNSPTTVFNQDTDLRYTWLYNSLLGFSVEQVVGKLDCELFGSEDAQQLLAIKRRVLTTGVGTREEAFIKINGEVRYYALTVEPLLGSAGEITGITCAAMDITEIRAREQQLRAIFESSLDAIAIVDDEGTYVEANPAASQLFGLPLPQLLGKPIADLMAPGFDFERVWRTVVELGQGTGELRLLRPDGTVRDVEYAAKASFLPGRHLAVLRDITERKQAEEIRRALEAEQELRRLQLRFFSMVSHEFRTPLSTILGSAQLLKSCTQAWTEEKKLRNLSRIETAAKNMTQLLDDLLTINRAESGKLECNPQPLNLEKFCRRLVEDLQLQAGSKHEITLTIQAQCPMVSLDEKFLRSILTNLLSNAIKYSPQGGKIHLDLTCNQKEAIFQIQDQGIGIPLEDQTHLFELFHRGKNIENIPGTGLGLSVVKQCLDLQGGKILINSKVGTGTTVTVKIPLMQTARNNTPDYRQLNS